MSSRVVMGDSDLQRTIRRIAHEICEGLPDTGDLVVLGIPRRGEVLASRLASLITEITGSTVDWGVLDVTMYRDDVAAGGLRTPHPSTIPAGGVDGKVVVLVDDVLYSGRTVRAALDALTDIGRPKMVRLAVLVDRGHRELPIRADWVGKNLPSSIHERISVRFVETDGVDRVEVEA